MDKEYDIYGIIADVVEEETKFLRHYIGKVVDVNDPMMKGRVLVTVDELGFDKNSIGLWCVPRDKNALTTPAIGDYVEVYFISGDVNRPVYVGTAMEMDSMLPKKYDGMPDTHVLFENPKKDSDSVVYKGTSGELIFLGGTEHVVLGDKLKTELQKNIDALTQLKTDFNAWTPVPMDGGAALKTILSSGFLTKTLASLTSVLSTLMKVK